MQNNLITNSDLKFSLKDQISIVVLYDIITRNIVNYTSKSSSLSLIIISSPNTNDIVNYKESTRSQSNLPNYKGWQKLN